MDTYFSELEYQGVTFRLNDYRKALVEKIEFVECKFLKCNFREAQILSCKFNHCTFVDCDFGLVSLKNSQFMETTFKKCQLIGINWTETSLARKHYIKPVDFIECVLNHCTFTGLSLKKLQISHCVSHNVDFSDADLTQTNCRQTDFASSRFHHTCLTGADFTGATNYSISVIDNPVNNAKFSLPEAMSLLDGLGIELTDSIDPI